MRHGVTLCFTYTGDEDNDPQTGEQPMCDMVSHCVSRTQVMTTNTLRQENSLCETWCHTVFHVRR